jgi:hypothetical protein
MSANSVDLASAISRPAAGVAGVRWLLVTTVVTASACGVQEVAHHRAAENLNDDLGPSSVDASMGDAPSASETLDAGSTSGPETPDADSDRDAGTSTPTSSARPAKQRTNAQRMPAATPAATVIDIGGTAVLREDAIAFLHFGHSNMAGWATKPMQLRAYFFDETDPHAWMYHVGKPLELAKEPYTATVDFTGQHAGPGTALVKQAAALAPGKYFISLGYGKGAAYCSQFLPGSLYYDAMMQAALAIKGRVTFAAIIIMLGVTERHGTADDIAGFSNCIGQLVSDVRGDLDAPDLPMLISDYEQEATGDEVGVNSAFAKAITPEIRKIPSVVPNSAIVPTDGLGMEDDHHFDLDGHRLWIERALQIMQDKGWFPWR